MVKSKVLDKILGDKHFHVDRRKVQFRDDDAMLRTYSNVVQNRTKKMKPRRNAKMNYVGIEIECFTKLRPQQIIAKLLEHDLEKNVHLGNDGSIHPNFGNPLEMRVLFPEDGLEQKLNTLGKVFEKSGTFGVNDSCGLHIHLDMRNRNLEECYQRLLKFQDVLFGLVKSNRWNRHFCQYTHTTQLHAHRFDRYVAINRSAYNRHRTIEVRLHHATLDVGRINKWIKLLLTIINSKTTPPGSTKSDILDWAKKEKAIGAYVARNFNDQWFVAKRGIVAGREILAQREREQNRSINRRVNQIVNGNDNDW